MGSRGVLCFPRRVAGFSIKAQLAAVEQYCSCLKDTSRGVVGLPAIIVVSPTFDPPSSVLSTGRASPTETHAAYVFPHLDTTSTGAVMTDEKRFARSQKFNISDQMWSIQAEEQGLTPGDMFCSDPDRADPEPMVRP